MLLSHVNSIESLKIKFLAFQVQTLYIIVYIVVFFRFVNSTLINLSYDDNNFEMSYNLQKTIKSQTLFSSLNLTLTKFFSNLHVGCGHCPLCLWNLVHTVWTSKQWNRKTTLQQYIIVCLMMFQSKKFY